MANTTLGLKNVNLMTKEQYAGIAEPASDELYAVSGSGFGFPSNNYDDLKLGANGTTYTAPANGWFYLYKGISANQYFAFTNTTKGYRVSNAPSATNAIMCIFPVQKGDVIQVGYSASGTTNVFRFIYAEGE